MKHHLLTVTNEDNVAALDERDAIPLYERWRWDACAKCPTAQALNRQFPDLNWVVNRNGARPEGASSYWVTFGDELTHAIDLFDTAGTYIVGVFKIYSSKL